MNYDTVYASRENQEKATNNAQKIRQLQQNELQCTMDQVSWPRKKLVNKKTQQNELHCTMDQVI